jgi:uncharacterized protein
MSAKPMIGFGTVRHARLRPAQHAFSYPTYFLMLPMRSLAALPDSVLARNRFAAISFFDRDHGDGRDNALLWLDELLRDEGIDDATGEIWLHCYPRVLGYTFKPVSFWYCHRADQSLRAIVVEVNNTFGEKHVYLLDQAKLGQEMLASKVFHVSPFCEVQGQYRFRFMLTADFSRTVARIAYDDQQGALITTGAGCRGYPQSLARLRLDDLRRDHQNPLACASPLAQARAFFHQARGAQRLGFPFISPCHHHLPCKPRPPPLLLRCQQQRPPPPAPV